MKRFTNAGCDDTRMELIFKMKSKKTAKKHAKHDQIERRKKRLPEKCWLMKRQALYAIVVCLCVFHLNCLKYLNQFPMSMWNKAIHKCVFLIRLILSLDRSILQCCAHTRYTATIWWSQTSISTYLNIQFYRIRSLIMILSPPSTGWRSPSRMNSIFGFFSDRHQEKRKKTPKHLTMPKCTKWEWLNAVCFIWNCLHSNDRYTIYLYVLQRAHRTAHSKVLRVI